MAIRTMLIVLGALAALGCADPRLPVMQQAILDGPYQSAGPSVWAPISTGCRMLDPSYDAGMDSPMEREQNTFCSIIWAGMFYQDEDGIYDDTLVYIHSIGEFDPDHPLAGEPWARDQALYCLIRHRFSSAPVPGYPESDVQRIEATVVEATGPCSTIIGRTYPGFLVRGSEPGTFFEVHSDESGMLDLYRGTAGVAGTGDDPNWQIDAHCTPTLGIEGRGYCEPRCRLWSADPEDGLEACTWADAPILPANPDLIDQSWIAAHRELYEQVFPADG